MKMQHKPFFYFNLFFIHHLNNVLAILYDYVVYRTLRELNESRDTNPFNRANNNVINRKYNWTRSNDNSQWVYLNIFNAQIHFGAAVIGCISLLSKHFFSRLKSTKAFENFRSVFCFAQMPNWRLIELSKHFVCSCHSSVRVRVRSTHLPTVFVPLIINISRLRKKNQIKY